MLWKGSQVPRSSGNIIGRERRRGRDEKGNQGAWDFRFINILQVVSIYFFISFFNYFTLSFFFYTFFAHDIYPHPHPQPATHTNDPRPLPTTHDQRHLATLLLECRIRKVKLHSSALWILRSQKFISYVAQSFESIFWKLRDCFLTWNVFFC